MRNGQDYGWQPQRGDGQQQGDGRSWHANQYDPGAHRQRIGRLRSSSPPQGMPRLPYPQDGAPWQQPGYGPPGYRPQAYDQQPYDQQPDDQQYPLPYPPEPSYGQPYYAPGPPQRTRRGRHTVRNVLAGLGGLVIAIVAISIAAKDGHSVQTMGSTAATSNASGTTPATKAPERAGIGSAITIAGNDNGEQMAVTVTKVINSAQPGDEFSGAPTGDRLYAVQFRLHDTGSAAYSDSPSNGAAVVDSAGQSYEAAMTDTVTECQAFPGSENIAPGASGLGCIVFEVPESAKITEVQFTLDSGFGPQTGQWNVR